MTFVHMELNTSDVEAAKKFYASVFGWTYQDMPMENGTYTMVTGPQGPVGGIQPNPMPEAPSNWLAYGGVASIDETIATVKDGGGTVIVPRVDIPGMGSFAVFTDPTGAAFAAWEPHRTAEDAQQQAEAAPAAEPAAATQAKKATKKKAANKKAAKKAPAKKAAKKAPAKKASKKKAAKKAPAKKASKKKAAKKAPAKKASKKKAAKKAPAKKASKKKAASKKKSAKRQSKR